MTTDLNNPTRRSMSSVCRRLEQLRREGVRPDTLSWAVAEASEAATRLANMPGREMVRSCLAEARTAAVTGLQSEALIVLAAAGVGRTRSELRALGVPLPLTERDAHSAIRKTTMPSMEAAMQAVRKAGAPRLLALVDDRDVPFRVAVAREIVDASGKGDGDRVQALCEVGRFGVANLRRGVRIEVRDDVTAYGVEAMATFMACERPRQVMRRHARSAQGEEATLLAALSFVQTSYLNRSVQGARRTVQLKTLRAIRKTPKPDADAAFEAIQKVGASHVLALMCDRDVPFYRGIANEVVTATEAGDHEQASALREVGALGIWGLRHGVKVDVADKVRAYGIETVGEILSGDHPRVALLARARETTGAEAEELAALYFVHPRYLERSVRTALHHGMAGAFRKAEAFAMNGQAEDAGRVGGERDAVAIGEDGQGGR